MPTSYQPKQGGSIEIVCEKAASDILIDLNKRPDSSETIDHEEEFINAYVQQNNKRIQSSLSGISTESPSLLSDDDFTEKKDVRKSTSTRSSRHASARRLFEVNEWEEQQKRLKQKFRTGELNNNYSYNEIKATTEELLKDYDRLINKHDFETHRRREFIYRHYRFNVREPFLLAKIKQLEQLDKTRANRTRFQTQQYNQFLQFINTHHYITQDDYDKHEYDAMAQYNDRNDEIRTPLLSDPTLLSYYKWMNDRRTLSSLDDRNERRKYSDPRRIVSEQGFRFYHRTATPLSNGRSAHSALSWQEHEQTNIESPIRRLASAKCYYIEQKSQNPTDFDPTDRSLSCLRHRSASSSIRQCTPTN